MNSEQNKELVKQTWAAFGKGDIKSAFANMADNISWLVPGNMPGTSGVKKGKDQILEFMSGVGKVFPEGLTSEFQRVYCDGDTVIVEMTNRGKAHNGKSYQNEYCFIFEIEAGKIRRIREYVDTQKFIDTVMK
ncbi:MAG TPA: nuclear transport factor 2 family protein [Candidatus Binataceae bacterium]|nr:nuclear transport factor 2 family protein [Candidatus Binataceae bacterium]